MAVEYEISSDVAVIKETGSVSQCARVTQMYSGQITYDDEAGSKFATATINGKSQRVMLCIAVSGTVTYDDVPSLYSTVDGHRCLNIVTPTETGTPDDVPSLYETVVIDGQNVRAVRCIMINKTPVYDGVSSTCTFTGDDGKTHTAQLVNKITGGSVVVIIKGTSPLVLPDAIANSLSYVKAFGGTRQGLPSEYQLYTEVEAGGVTYTYSSQNLTQIPCMRIADNVFGLYNLITQTFTGDATFISNGTPITSPSPQYDIPLVSNNGVLKARHQSGLPLGYMLLDYVETDGNSYIDTNLLLSNTSEFEITFQSADATLNTPVMGAISGGTSFTSTNNLCVTYTVASGLNAYSVYCNGAAGDANESWNAGDAQDRLKHTVKYNGLNIAPTIDGVDMEQLVPATLTTNTPTVTTWLFGRNNTGSGTKTQTGVRIYDFKVVGIAHFVPCKNASNVIGMYDLVSGTFFTNDGTGDFVAGNTVSDPVEIYTDGTVETINVHGKNLFDKSTALLGDLNTSGAYVSRTYRVVSDYIPVKFGQTFVGSGTLLDTNGVEYTANVIKAFYKADKSYIAGSRASVVGNKFTIDDNECAYIRIVFFNTSLVAGKTVSMENSVLQLEEGSTATAYQPYFDGGTATAEMLLKVGDYQDVQSIIDGVVTRNVGVKALDGTEDWTQFSVPYNVFTVNIPDAKGQSDWSVRGAWCSHFLYWVSETTPTTTGASPNTMWFNPTKGLRAKVDVSIATSVAQLKQWFADQYTAGTPVIVLYPLATPTTETVTGQTLQVTDGDNTLEITQASLTGLELEAQYNAAVSLTIQEVQDANLDNNVTVTIQ